MSTRNPDQRAPGPDDLTNRYHRNTYEYAVAQNRDLANRTRRDHAELKHMEGLARQAVPSFYQSVHDADHTVANEYQYVEAGQQAGRVEPGRTNPTSSWQHIAGPVSESFADAASGDQGPPVRTPLIGRRLGADNPHPQAPVMMGLYAGERPRQIVVVAQPDPAAPWRQQRLNQARVED